MQLYLSCDPNVDKLIYKTYHELKSYIEVNKAYPKNFDEQGLKLSLSQDDMWLVNELDFNDFKVLKSKWQLDYKQAKFDESLTHKWQDCAFMEFTPQGAYFNLGSLPKVKGLHLDFTALNYRQRLLRGGRQKEAIARAVMHGLKDGECVLDATCGLGRESMILAHARAHVLACERQLPMWILLFDAFNRAKSSRFFPFTLPTLLPLGSLLELDLNALCHSDNIDLGLSGRIEVIYYDPMFPEKSHSAQVKKDMFIFQQAIGQDQDSLNFLYQALKLAHKKVVVKRPNSCPPLKDDNLNIKCAYSVDGGQCRFDCYIP